MAFKKTSSVAAVPAERFEEHRGYKPINQWRYWQLDRRAHPCNQIIQEKSRRAGSTEAFAGDAIEYGCGLITRKQGQEFKLPHGYTWQKRCEYTGDPRKDCGLPDWYIDYLKAHAREDGVYDQVQWEHEPAVFLYAVVPEFATDVYIVHANEDLAVEWLQTRVLETYWPKYIPVLMPVYGRAEARIEKEEQEETDTDDEEEAARKALERKHTARKSVMNSRVILPSKRAIHALATSARNQGMGGTVLWDEAAVIEKAHQIKLAEALKPVNDLGGKLIIASRHNGRDVPFYDMVEDAKAKPRNWHVPFINLYTAIIQGARMGDGSLINIATIKDKITDEADYRQQYLCEARAMDAAAATWENDEIVEFRKRTRNPVRYMVWEGGEWKPTHYATWPTFHLKIWHEPEPNTVYCIGADFATGRSTDKGRENATAFQVCFASSGSLVAQAHGLISAYDAARAVAALGKMFNTAYLVPEFDRIGPGSQAIEWLTGYSGERLYPAHAIHGEDGARKGTAGVSTSKSTRNNMLDVFIQWTRREVLQDASAELPCARLVAEMAAFRWNEEKQKFSGYPRDDLVTAMALAVHGVHVHRKNSWRTTTAAPPTPKPPPMPWINETEHPSTPYWDLGLEPVNTWEL